MSITHGIAFYIRGTLSRSGDLNSTMRATVWSSRVTSERGLSEGARGRTLTELGDTASHSMLNARIHDIHPCRPDIGPSFCGGSGRRIHGDEDLADWSDGGI